MQEARGVLGPARTERPGKPLFRNNPMAVVASLYNLFLVFHSQNRDCDHDAVRSLHLVFVADRPNGLRPAVGPFDDLGEGGSSPFHAVGDSPGSTNRILAS